MKESLKVLITVASSNVILLKISTEEKKITWAAQVQNIFYSFL